MGDRPEGEMLDYLISSHKPWEPFKDEDGLHAITADTAIMIMMYGE